MGTITSTPAILHCPEASARSETRALLDFPIVRDAFWRSGGKDEPLRVPVPLHDLAHRGGEVVTGGFEVRVDGERAPEEVGGLAVLTQCDVAETLAGQRPEVVGLAREGLLAIGDGCRVVLLQVSH